MGVKENVAIAGTVALVIGIGKAMTRGMEIPAWLTIAMLTPVVAILGYAAISIFKHAQTLDKPATTPPPPHPIPPASPVHNDMAQVRERLVNQVREIASGEREIFALLGGAVFALQQDTFARMAIDMRQLPNPTTQAAVDQLQPHPSGNHPERYQAMVAYLPEISNRFIDAEEGCTGSIPEKLYLRMGAVAARIWLVTMLAHVSNDAVQKAQALAIWKMLDLLQVDEITWYAQDYTGRFFNGPRCDVFKTEHWGLLPDMR